MTRISLLAALPWLFVALSDLPAAEIELADGEVRIFLANADGSDMKRLTDLPKYTVQGSPTWSRDGKRIAFDANQAGETTSQTRVIVVDADGSNPRVLIDGAMPSFSPGGNRIAFSRYAPNYGVWVMSAEGPDKELVLLDEQGWSADWSPDGTRVVYAKSMGNGQNLIVFDLIEGTSHNLFKVGEEPYTSVYWNFLWSPDSRQIVFRGTKRDGQVEVAIVDARGAEHGLTTRLVEKSLSSNFAWSPDGAKLLVSFVCPERERRMQLYALDPRTLDAPQLLPGQNPDLIHAGIAYSPDGKRLAISSRKPKAVVKN
jgi:Tol biopolymer transport system component